MCNETQSPADWPADGADNGLVTPYSPSGQSPTTSRNGNQYSLNVCRKTLRVGKIEEIKDLLMNNVLPFDINVRNNKEIMRWVERVNGVLDTQMDRLIDACPNPQYADFGIAQFADAECGNHVWEYCSHNSSGKTVTGGIC
jgi:hypothetical protein